MTFTVNEEVVERVHEIGSTPWSGRAYRYTAERRDPLSGAGARRFGGRWNPSDIVPAIYLAVPESTCMGELDRAASSQGVSADTLISAPKTFHEIEIGGLKMLDLSQPENLDLVGLSMEDIEDEDWQACQLVGHAAWFLEYSGLLAPSASGSGLVVTVFEDRVTPGILKVVGSQPLSVALYRELSTRK